MNETIHALNQQISALTPTIDQHRADVALLQRLKIAPDELKRATAELGALNTKLAAAWADHERGEREAFKASLRNITITKTGDGEGLKATYTVSYEKRAWDMNARETVWRKVSTTGLAVVDPLVIRYILTFEPQKLPTFILGLCPGDPVKAMDRYLTGLNRGCLRA